MIFAHGWTGLIINIFDTISIGRLLVMAEGMISSRLIIMDYV